MKFLRKSFGNPKDGKREKGRDGNHPLCRLESASSISLSQYYVDGGATISGDDANLYAWSVADNISSTMSTSEDDSEHDEPVKKPLPSKRTDLLRSMSQDEGDPLDNIDISKLRIRNVPVKSTLQSSTMRLDILNDRSPLHTRIANNRSQEEKRSGPVDVDNLEQIYELSETQQIDTTSKRNIPLHHLSESEVEQRKGQYATGSPFQMELGNDLKRFKPQSSGLSSKSGSEGDSLRNLGDENLDYIPISYRYTDSTGLKNEVQYQSDFNTAWLSQLNPEKINGPGNSAVTNQVPQKLLSESVQIQSETRREKLLATKKDGATINHFNAGKSKKGKKKKSIKSQVVTAFQSLLRTNSHDINDNRNSRNKKSRVGLQKPKLQKNLSCISMIPIADGEPPWQNNVSAENAKAELRRDVSSFSTTPLTGDTVIDFPKKKKLQNAKELLLEKERRRILAGNLQMKQKKKKEMDWQRHLCEQEIKREQKRFGVEEGGVDEMLTHAIIANVEKNRNREKLQNWVMGCSNLTMDPSHSKESTISSALSLIKDGENTATCERTIRSPHDESTAKVDNTLPNPNTLHRCRENFDKIEKSYSDDHSSTLTSEASPPSQNSLLCVLCGDRNRTHLAVPCMHFSYCEECVAKMEMNDKKCCPVCNAKEVSFRKLLW